MIHPESYSDLVRILISEDYSFKRVVNINDTETILGVEITVSPIRRDKEIGWLKMALGDKWKVEKGRDNDVVLVEN